MYCVLQPKLRNSSDEMLSGIGIKFVLLKYANDLTLNVHCACKLYSKLFLLIVFKLGGGSTYQITFILQLLSDCYRSVKKYINGFSTMKSEIFY